MADEKPERSSGTLTALLAVRIEEYLEECNEVQLLKLATYLFGWEDPDVQDFRWHVKESL